MNLELFWGLETNCQTWGLLSAKKVYESEIVPKFLKLSFQLQQVGIGETTSDHNNQQTRFIYTSIQTEFRHVLPIVHNHM